MSKFEPASQRATSQQWRKHINHLLDAVAKVSEYSHRKEILQTTAIKMVYLLEGETCIVSTWDEEAGKITPESFHTTGEWQLPASWYSPREPEEHPLFLRVKEERKSVQFNLGGMTLPLSALKVMERDGVQSWVAFPLLGTDQTLLGIVDVLDSRGPRHFRDEMINFGELLTNLASATYQRALLLDRKEEKARQLSALMSAASAVSSSLSLQEVLERVAHAMANLVEVEACGISDYSAGKGELRLLAEYSSIGEEIGEESFWPFHLKDYPVTAQVLMDKQPIQIQIDQPDIDPAEKAFMEAAKLKSLLMLPLVTEGKSIGLVELMDGMQLRKFTQEEIDLLYILSAHAAKALDNARLYESEQQQRKLAEALVQAAKIVNSSLDWREVLDLILEQTMSVMQCKSANLMMIEGEIARAVGHRGYAPQPDGTFPIEKIEFPLSVPSFAEMLGTRKPILIPDTEQYEQWVKFAGNEWIRSYASIPLGIGENIIGFLSIDSEIPNFFTGKTLSGLEALASHAAIALNNAQLYQSLEQRAAELEIARQASLTLTSSLDLETVLNLILQQSLKVSPDMLSGHIFLYHDGVLEFGAAFQSDGTVGKVFSEPRQSGLTYTVARSGEMILVGDMQSHPLYAGGHADWHGSILGLPLKYGNLVVGVMNLSHPEPYYFKTHHIRPLKLLADQAAISIVNARLHNRVEEQSRTDPLTSLNNRRAFTLRLQEETQRSERYHRTFSLAMMDLNGFKKINDTFGHPVGDKILIKISQCILKNTRNTDFLVRYGGDEFALLMPETSLEIATKVATRIQRALEEFDFDMSGGGSVPISISIGLAVYPQNGRTPEEMIKAADDMLYQAKRQALGHIAIPPL